MLRIYRGITCCKGAFDGEIRQESCHPKYGRGMCGNNDDVDEPFGVIAKKADIEPVLEVVPAKGNFADGIKEA